MAFEGLRDRLKDQWGELSSKIQENPTFNSIREKFEAQPIHIQRIIVAVVAMLAVLFVLSFPYGYISSSSELLSQFDENRALIQGLLKASRTAKEPSPLPPPITSDMLKGRVDGMLRSANLVADQIGEIQPLPEHPAKGLAPAVVEQTGLVVQLKKLNLDQMINLAHSLQELGPGVKLMGLDVVQSAGQSHYYDMIARLVHFSLPVMSDIDDEAPTKGAGKNKKRPALTPKNEDTEE